MKQRLAGRIALVTGAASGIGRAIAERLASEGAAIVVTDIMDEAGMLAVKQLTDAGARVLYIHLDVASEAEWTGAIDAGLKEFGHLDILVNNAGICESTSIEELTLEEWSRTVAVDQTGTFLGMKCAGHALTASDHASIINISSIAGSSGGFGMFPAYAAAKGAVRNLTKNTAMLWAQRGIRVNSIHPGFIDTGRPLAPEYQHLKDSMVSMTPMGRLGRPEEVAAAVAYLASDDAAFVTGTELYIDGGYMAR